MSAILYVNKNGKNVWSFSHSMGQTFHDCARRFKYEKIDGWKEKSKKASMEFGKCIEDSIQYFHKNAMLPNSATNKFSEMWNIFKDNKELVYTDDEKDWDTLNLMGFQMMCLYELKIKSLPIKTPIFQLNYSKEVFPGTKFAGIKFQAYVDMLCNLETDNPLVIDIKTSSKRISEIPGIVALDPQLRKYAWVTGHRNVGFLNFIKTNPNIKFGDKLTLLTDLFLPNEGIVPAGTTLIDVSSEGLSSTVTCLTESAFKNLKKEGKKAMIACDSTLVIPYTSVTKQQIQFLTGTVDEQAIIDTGELIGRDIISVHESYEKNFWPQEPGIKFPNNHCTFCPMLGLCLNNQEMIDEKIEQDTEI